MALVVYWYDFICFAIIAGAISGSLWMLWKKEGGGKNDQNTRYESLLVNGLDGDGFVGATRSGHLSSGQLWTSCWRGLNPLLLLVFRAVSCVVMIGFLMWDVRRYDTSIFVYYTEWTFALVIVYFGLGTILSAHGWWMYSMKTLSEYEASVESGRHLNQTTRYFRTIRIRDTIKLQSDYEQAINEQRTGFWGYLMQALYQTCAGAVVLTDIVFWCIIVPFLSSTRLGLNLLMGCMHTMNAVLLLLDTSLNRLPFPWFRITYFVLWSCLYVIFQWVIHACGFTWWPYPFLELSTPWAPLWYFCLAVMHIPCYGLYILIVKAKDSIFSRLFPHAYIRSS